MRSGLWLSLLLFAAALWGCAAESAAPRTQPAEAPPALAEKILLTADAPSAGFPSRRSFEQHFEKHRDEFGGVTAEQYLALAQRLRDKPAGGDILEAIREDGVITRFDRQTGHFGAYNPDRTIRTFFIPNDGERYFERQARRAP